MDNASLLDLLFNRIRQDPSPEFLQQLATSLGQKRIPYVLEGNSLNVTLALPGRVVSMTLMVRPSLAAHFGPQPMQQVL
jgi:hypothetical protein